MAERARWCCHVYRGGLSCGDPPTHRLWEKGTGREETFDFCGRHLAAAIADFCEVWPIGFDDPPAPSDPGPDGDDGLPVPAPLRRAG